MPETTHNQDRIVLREQSSITQVIGQPPGWITRWGITLVLLIVSVLFLLSYLVKFPDRLPAKVVIVTENPPIKVVSPKSAKIKMLLVDENEAVKEEDILAILENTASYKDVLALEKFVAGVEKNTDNLAHLVGMSVPKNLKIGTLQPVLAIFQKDYDDLMHYLKKNGIHRKVRKIRAQIVSLKKLNTSLQRQEELLQQEVELANTDLKRKELLEQEGVISKEELENYNKKLLRVQREKERLNAEINKNDISIRELEVSILSLKTDKSFSQDKKMMKINEDIQNLVTAIENWKKDNLLTAPVSGKIAFTGTWKNNSFIKAGEPLLTVVPEGNTSRKVGKAYLKMQGSGKVKVGQPVNIRLDGYNFQEFGIVKATVGQISLVPNGDQYLLDLVIPDTLKTTYGKIIPFRQEMNGTGFIITEDRRILDRIFDKIFSLIKNK